MPDNSNNNNKNRQVKSNALPNQSPDNIEDAIWRLKIHDNQEQGGMAPSSAYPDRPGQPDCVYYLRTGLCGYGSNCRFNHPPAAQGTQFIEELPERVGQPDCGYYLKTGTCKYGSTCKYHHPRDRNGAGPVSFNILGLPMRQDEKSCPYYMRTGSCKFGVACKFHHPQPVPLGAGLPLTGPAGSGPMGSSIVPSSGLPYVGGLPTWSLPRAPYASGPHLQGPQAYMPVVLSPSQGVVSAQGWNTYVAQPVCSNYSMYGLCKFGPTCRFDHPSPGYPYSYSLNLQPVSIFDSSLLTHPRMSAPALSAESPVSLSSKFPGWVRNPDGASNKRQNSNANTKIADDQPEQASSPPPHSSQASSEPSHD
ncbi:hypothetical protein GH714_019255 [Hevea brasiliensis]|uniref:C3H1-type domain-containing protein n=1 Tax=Hevea brasiliensis TaxID=3981 RepID=A0A6A6KUK4_HEVBR|nr:hypothetical protein GH714_019255 [Hevea brasiliensis]